MSNIINFNGVACEFIEFKSRSDFSLTFLFKIVSNGKLVLVKSLNKEDDYQNEVNVLKDVYLNLNKGFQCNKFLRNLPCYYLSGEFSNNSEEFEKFNELTWKYKYANIKYKYFIITDNYYGTELYKIQNADDDFILRMIHDMLVPITVLNAMGFTYAKISTDSVFYDEANNKFILTDFENVCLTGKSYPIGANIYYSKTWRCRENQWDNILVPVKNFATKMGLEVPKKLNNSDLTIIKAFKIFDEIYGDKYGITYNEVVKFIRSSFERYNISEKREHNFKSEIEKYETRNYENKIIEEGYYDGRSKIREKYYFYYTPNIMKIVNYVDNKPYGETWFINGEAVEGYQF